MADLQARTGLSPMEVHAVRGLDPHEPTATLTLAGGSIASPPTSRPSSTASNEAGSSTGARTPVTAASGRLVTLTARGLTVRSQINAYLHTPPAAINHLTPAEQRTLRDLLRKMTPPSTS